MGLKKYKIVEIEWKDAVVGSAEKWTDPKQLKNKAMPSKSVGYLMYEDDDVVTVASLVNKNHVGFTLTIPRGMIKKMKEVK